jgi:hypothetical protein
MADDEIIAWLKKKAKSPDEIESRVIGIFSPPGHGKTVLAARFDEPTLIITDEMNGITSFKNHLDLKPNVKGVPFRSHSITRRVLQAVESGDFVHDDGRSFKVVVLDTISGMISLEIQNIVKAGVTPAKGRVSAESASQPDYMVSEKRVMELMNDVANLTTVTTVLLSHQRIGDKLTPGDNTRPDVHAAAFRVINKYASVIAYLEVQKDGTRRLQVMPNGNGVSVKTRYHFPSEFVSDDEFVAHIRKWKNNERAGQ